MILNARNTDFAKEGASSKEELMERKKAILYESESRITSMSYSGKAADKIILSSSIPPDFLPDLKEIKGYVSMGTTKVFYSDNGGISSGLQYKNAHIYSSRAKTLSGSERICYLYRIDANTIGVREYNGNKGASYSGLYPILQKRLLKNGFIKSFPDDNFNISLAEIKKFVQIINEVITEHENGKYELVKEEDKFDTITLGKNEEQKKLYYNVAYWREKETLETENNLLNNENKLENIIYVLNDIMGKIENIDNIQDIESVIKKLDSMITMGKAKKVILEIKKDI